MKHLLAVLIMISPVLLHAGIEGPLIKLGVKQLMNILTKDGQGSHEALKQLGGEKGVEELLETSFNQGGTGLVSRVVYYGKNYGGDALTVISPAPKDMVAALDQLDSQGQEYAIRGAARDPVEMSELVQAHGSDVLKLSIKHPGLAATMMEALGEYALSIGRKLNTDEVMVLVSMSDSVKTLPGDKQAEFFKLLESHPADLVIALEMRPDLLLTDHFMDPVKALRLLIKEGVPLPRFERTEARTLDYLVGSLPLMVLILAGALLVSWGVSGLVPSASA